MRHLLAVTAALLALAVVSGCDAGNLDATDHALTVRASPTVPRSSVYLPTPARSRSAEPSEPSKPSRSAKAHPRTGTPAPTAMATDTANTGTSGSSGVPTTYAAAIAGFAALKGASHTSMTRFTTPGDTVYCVLRDRYVPTSCELGHGAIRDPRVCAQSMADAVGRIQLGDDGAAPECNSDTIRQPGAKTISPPAVVTLDNLECAVEKIGVTCLNTRAKVGFFLTPGKYATFSG
ncbi:MAG: hypothetical protein FWE71_06210 [Nocardioidaceae bacterium]|nr:hypothetical protein [Nocardioidaceae bacterium]MCL2611808.1 hypothetical protein [Nocardioidaceae bacterium]